MTESDIALTTAGTWVLDVLQAANGRPMPVAEILTAVRGRHNVRMARPTAYGALERLRVRSRVVYVDDVGHPRRWLAVPDVIA